MKKTILSIVLSLSFIAIFSACKSQKQKGPSYYSTLETIEITQDLNTTT